MNDRYGPFHRKKSPTQTYETALKQKQSGEIWGRPMKVGGLFPKVKAYLKPLCAEMPPGSDCADSEGIEFTTRVKPSQKLPSGLIVWSLDQESVDGLRRIDDETIALAVSISKVVYSEAGSRGSS